MKLRSRDTNRANAFEGAKNPNGEVGSRRKARGAKAKAGLRDATN
ncbi:unnamed protein product, partial [Toxocara canis]|uniref:Stress-induced protein n=1 Tax=Toxocara canis TaxID=6265 RepID=A0A183TZ85_TOXCA